MKLSEPALHLPDKNTLDNYHVCVIKSKSSVVEHLKNDEKNEQMRYKVRGQNSQLTSITHAHVILIEVQPLLLQVWSDLFLNYTFNTDKAASILLV